MKIEFNPIDSAPKDGSILLTNEGCVYWDGYVWLLCSPTWRSGKPDHFPYSDYENGCFEVDPVFWARHPHEPKNLI